MGDTGTGSPGQKTIADAVAAKCKKDGCDFVQLLGDNLYDSGASSVDDPIWQSTSRLPYAAIDLDFYAVLGNHDYGANGAGTDFPKGKNEIDYTTKSKKWKMPSAYFHFTKGNVELFALDTNMALFSQAGRAEDGRDRLARGVDGGVEDRARPSPVQVERAARQRRQATTASRSRRSTASA